MPVAFDAASNASNTAGTTLTFAHTCTGDNRVLVVGAETESPRTITGVTYAGTAMTAVTNITSGGQYISMWQLVAPATGANNIVVTASANEAKRGCGVSFTGANQTTPVGTAATATGTSTAITVDVSSATDEMVVDVANSEDNTDPIVTFTVGAGQTERATITNSALGRTAMSTEAGAATVTMSWTISESKTWGTIGVSVKEAAAAATTVVVPGMHALLGVG